MSKKRLSSLRFVQENRQLLFGITLIIFIPGLVVFNSFIFFRGFTRTLDIELHARAITIGQITSTLIGDSINNPAELQLSLEEIINNSPELTYLEISRPVGADLIVWASTEEENVGTRETNTASLLAWQNNRPIAFRIGSTGGEEKYWAIHYPLRDAIGEAALLKMNLSTETVESAARNVLWQSFLLLIGVIVVIILLLLVNSQLFQYAVLYRKLREVDQAKDDFISVASHELRTPITAIRNYFSMLRDGSYGRVSKETKESLEFMSTNVHRLQILVEDLLNVSRIQQGRFKIDKKDFDVTVVIRDVIDTLKPNAQEKDLKLAASLPSRIMVHADEDRLKQILVNIIGNAIKYTEKGSITTTVTFLKDMVSIKVKDTGMGMSPDEQERLFEKFYRAQNKKTRDITGSGLGLWITKAIVELMGGKIYMNSIENTGTQVTVTVPLATGGEDAKK